jgi:hypothetical protein
MLIMQGEKTIEWRSWKTDYRGDLLICSTAKRVPNCISGHALCVARLTDVVPFTREHLDGAALDTMPSPAGYAWMLEDVRFIKPFAIKGQQGFYSVDHPIEYYVDNGDDAEAEDFANRFIIPLIYTPDRR